MKKKKKVTTTPVCASRPNLLVAGILGLVTGIIQLSLLQPGASTQSTQTVQLPDHLRVVVIIDNSTALESIPARLLSRNTDAASLFFSAAGADHPRYVEAAAKLFTFAETSLILDQARLIVSVIKIPADDLLAASRILCNDLRSATNIIGIVIASELGPVLYSNIAALSNASNIPVVDVVSDWRFSGYSSSSPTPTSLSEYFFHMRPSALHLVGATEDVVFAFRWDRMLMLYGDSTNLARMQRLIGNTDRSAVSEKAVLHLNNSNLFHVIQAVKLHWSTVVAELDELTTTKFLRLALRTGTLSTDFAYIITNPNAHLISMEDFAHNLPNITMFRLVVDNNASRNAVEAARSFEAASHYRYRVLVPDPADALAAADLAILDMPKILVYNRELPISLTSALLLDTLTLFRRAVTNLATEASAAMNEDDIARQITKTIVHPVGGITCALSSATTDPAQKLAYGRALARSMQRAKFEGVTGNVQFGGGLDWMASEGGTTAGSGSNKVEPKRPINTRELVKFDVLGLGGIGLQKIGQWLSTPAAIEEYKLKHNQLPPSQLTNPTGLRSLRLQLDEEALHLLKRSNLLLNKTLVVTTIKRRTLRVTTVLEEPYVMLRKDKNKPLPASSRSATDHPFEGYCVDLLDEIASVVGFNYRLHIVADGKYGSHDKKTNRWNGMIGEVVEGKADIAVAPLTITYAREKAVDFTKPFMNLGISILYVPPFKEPPSVFSFMQPLSFDIWLSVLITYAIVTVIFYAVGRFSPYEWHAAPVIPTGASDVHLAEQQHVQVTPQGFFLRLSTNVFTVANSAWFTAGTLMQQGSDVNPRAISTRIVGGAWWFFSLIIISSYTANLAAFLTVDQLYSPFESAEELARQSKVIYGALKAGSTENFFRESKIDTYRTMWTSMKDKDVFVTTNAEGIERVKHENGGYAFLMESTSLEYNVQKNCSILRQVGGLLDSKGYGIAAAHESPYRDLLSMAILELQEGDKLQMLYDKWWKLQGTCVSDEKKDSKAKVLGVQNIGGVFVILVVGLFLAAISAFFELVWYTTHHRAGGDVRTFWRRLVSNGAVTMTWQSKVELDAATSSNQQDQMAAELQPLQPIERLRESRRSFKRQQATVSTDVLSTPGMSNCYRSRSAGQRVGDATRFRHEEAATPSPAASAVHRFVTDCQAIGSPIAPIASSSTTASTAQEAFGILRRSSLTNSAFRNASSSTPSPIVLKRAATTNNNFQIVQMSQAPSSLNQQQQQRRQMRVQSSTTRPLPPPPPPVVTLLRSYVTANASGSEDEV